MSNRSASSVPILLYHLVRDDLPPGDAVISTGKFGSQMQHLISCRYSFIRLQDWHQHLNEGKPLPVKPVIVTFDDGFLDCYVNAWPILRGHRIPFHVFLVSGNLGRTNTWKGIEPGKLPLISTDQIREMAAEGVSFEAHSRTHKEFRGLALQELESEIVGCKSDLTSAGLSPSFFAYPYGAFTDDARRLVASGGYSGACTTIPGKNHSATDPFLLRRINISGKDSMLNFRLKLLCGYGLLHRSDLKRSARALLRPRFR